MDWTTFDPDTAIDWTAVAGLIPQWAAMESCIQDIIFHAEGSVATHTRMVVEALLCDPELQTLNLTRRLGVVLAAIFHDVAKPATRKEEFDPELGRIRVSHHGHSNMGARDAWLNLWRGNVDLSTRLQVFSLIAAHQKPFHVFSEPDPRIELVRLSSTHLTWRELLLLARADNRGRRAPSTSDTAEYLELVSLLCEDHGVLDAEWAFGNTCARNDVYRRNSTALYYAPTEPSGSRVVVLSAPPGSGKNTYLKTCLDGLEVISLDDIRAEMGISAEKDQGIVVQAAKKRAERLLANGVDFVWNATGTSKLSRDKIISTALSYNAHVSIHALDCPYETMLKRNRSRDRVVPESAIADMLLRWEPPMPGEAHELIWLDALTFQPVTINGPQLDQLTLAPQH